MAATTPVIDLGAILRALRRRADLSQRELAERSGVPPSTVARIESGAVPDPKFRTVERLVAAAGGSVTAGNTQAATVAEPEAPDDEPVDGAGRRFPAHLDVRPVVTAKDWWGGWWANWYNLPRHRWPRTAPDHTYDLDRDRRDRRRRRRYRQDRVARLRIARLDLPEAPDHVWVWTASDDAGRAVGWLGGFVRRRRADGAREFVVCDLEVAPPWRRYGLGRRLVGALRTELRRCGVPRARVLIDEPDLPYQFFQACGFLRGPGPQPAWLMLLPARD